MSKQQQATPKKELSPKEKTAIQYLIYGCIALVGLALVIGVIELYEYLCLNVWNI